MLPYSSSKYVNGPSVDESVDVIYVICWIQTDRTMELFLDVKAVLGALFVAAVGGAIAELKILLRVVPVADAKFGD